MTTIQEPLPGTPEAVDAECTCPVHDNNYGLGVVILGIRQFWINADCPIHGIEGSIEE